MTTASFDIVEHRGEILEKAIREKGYSITKLAERIGKSRQYIYNLFARPDINPDTMLEIGKIINYDFKPELHIFKAKEPRSKYRKMDEEMQHWKSKYLELLEENKKLKTKLANKKKK